MSTGPVMVITNFVGVHVNAANTGVGFQNPDGTYNVSGTAIGLGQTAHSAVAFAHGRDGDAHGISLNTANEPQWSQVA